ncbi:MAG: site-specific DNA-methyltransferase [Christensenellaceae bacterium]|jgi:adenine-specific DNA-methyltransferase|nr:site-specific DNA-methyltransferase [Christensenellaceae bacterium]
MEKIIAATSDKEKENLEKLTKLFPSIWTEVIRYELDGKEYETEVQGAKKITKKVIDPVKLRGLVGDTAGATDEIFQFTWAGKRDAERLATSPINMTLRPYTEESVGKDGTPGGFDSQNLYIEGDNLDVLKLLEQTYTGQVKMIYIDPPYNSGGDFLYNDKFKSAGGSWKKQSNEYDADGNLIYINNGSDGKYHTNWLNMMYPRLVVAQKLLTDDGVIFISIDEREVHNLRKISDEIFGEENFMSNIIWNSTKSVTNTALISVSHNHTLIYARNKQHFIENRQEFRLADDGSGFENLDNDPRGPWKADPFQVGGWRPNQQYEIVNPATGITYKPNPGCSWKNDFTKYQELVKDNRIVFGKTGEGGPQRKRFQSEAEDRGKVTTTLWTDAETTTNGTQLVKKMFGDRMVFSNPKPVGLIRRILELGSNRNCIVLDFFSGSATTAHAVMEANAADAGTRKFIMVQLPEDLDDGLKKSSKDNEQIFLNAIEVCDELKAPHLLTEIGKERIRRAGKRITEGNHMIAPNIDTGFRVLKIDKGALKDVHKRPSELTLTDILESVDKIEYGRSGLDLLFTAMLYNKINLDSIIETKTFEGKEVFIVRDVNRPARIYLACCFVEGITEGVVKQMAMLKPTKAVFSDKSFNSDDVKISMQQIIKTYSPSTKAAVLESM